MKFLVYFFYHDGKIRIVAVPTESEAWALYDHSEAYDDYEKAQILPIPSGMEILGSITDTQYWTEVEHAIN